MSVHDSLAGQFGSGMATMTIPSDGAYPQLQPGPIKVAFAKDVPPRVAHILNEILNLTVWEYEIFAEEADKLLEGPAVRMP